MTAGGAKILIVEKQPGPQDSLRNILPPNHGIAEADSCAAALAILRGEAIDLMALDLDGPSRQRQKLLQSVKNEFSHIEVVEMKDREDAVSPIEEAPFQTTTRECRRKPFDSSQVQTAIERAASRQQARHRLLSFLAECGGDHDLLEGLDGSDGFAKLPKLVAALFERRGLGLEPSEPLLDPSPTLEFLELLAETVEARDRFTRGHARRIAHYASLLAGHLEIEPLETANLRSAASLHDLGEIGVPTDLLLCPRPLDSAERSRVEQHAETGARLVESFAAPASISLAIRHHHEHWNGSGYPDGLSGEEIPLAARIIAIVDAFDAMNCGRPYRAARRRRALTEELLDSSGTHLDPTLAREFLFLLESGAFDLGPEVRGGPRQSDASAPSDKPLASGEKPRRSRPSELRTPVRCARRRDEVRIAEYSPFPRENASQQPRIGFTRDVSALGMCLGVDHPETVGGLLRVDLRTLDGESMGASVARVVWCNSSHDRRHWLGLDLLCEIDRSKHERTRD